MDTSPRVEILTLDDELLLGIRENAHLKSLGAQLARHGFTVHRNIVIQNDAEEIKKIFLNSWERSDSVIMTGGLGTVRVNHTREAKASVLGIGLHFVPEVEVNIRADFESMGLKMGKRYLRQCYKFEGLEILPNNFETAPGLCDERESKILIMLPGIVSELRPIFQNEVIVSHPR